MPPLSHHRYPPDSFEHALLEKGVNGVRQKILERFRDPDSRLPWMECGHGVLRALCTDNSDNLLIETAWNDGWRGVAKWYGGSQIDEFEQLARSRTVDILGYIPALGLMVGMSSGGVPDDVRERARELHGRMSFERRCRDNVGGRMPLKPALERHRKNLQSTIERGCAIESAGPLNVLRAVEDARLASPDLGRDLPPPFDVLLELMEFAIADVSTPRPVRNELVSWLRFFDGCAQPDTGELRRIWQAEFEREVRAVIAHARQQLHRRDRGNRRYDSRDPRYDLLATKVALEVAPVRRAPHISSVALGRWLLGACGLRATRTRGEPSGPGHEFVLTAFKLYGVAPESIISGRYLRSTC